MSFLKGPPKYEGLLNEFQGLGEAGGSSVEEEVSLGTLLIGVHS